jgi:hypothetical protein
LACFEFPQKSIFYSVDYTVAERKKSFESFLARAQEIPELSYMLAQFLEVNNHIEEYESKIDQLFEDSCWHDSDSVGGEIERRHSFIIPPPAPTPESPRKIASNHLKPYRMLREIELRSVSKLLNDDMAKYLYTILPPHVQSERFELAYATHRDGWSSITFYENIGSRSPLLLLIRLVETSVVIGAFITTPLGPPSFGVKGDGQCFVFTLDGTKSAAYNCPRIINEEMLVAGTMTEYAYANMEYIAFGGSSIEGSNAIRLSNDLSSCSCGPSDTYNNPRLVDTDLPDPLKVSDVEVFVSGGVVA